MGYFVRLVDRELMPAGKDWLFLEFPDEDRSVFVIARDAHEVELSAKVLEAIVHPIARATGLQIALVS